MSLNIITVTLNMDSVNFLGISIVGQSTKSGDDGIYVGSIMKGGAVAQDGRIEPGDMILEVNGISFEDMSNDDAVRTLREQVQNPGQVLSLSLFPYNLPLRGVLSLLFNEVYYFILNRNAFAQGHDFALTVNAIPAFLFITFFFMFSPRVCMCVHELRSLSLLDHSSLAVYSCQSQSFSQLCMQQMHYLQNYC